MSLHVCVHICLHTHSFEHTHTYTSTHTHTYTLTHSLSLTHGLSHSHSHWFNSHTIVRKHPQMIYTHTHTHTHIHTHTHAHTTVLQERHTRNCFNISCQKGFPPLRTRPHSRTRMTGTASISRVKRRATLAHQSTRMSTDVSLMCC